MLSARQHTGWLFFTPYLTLVLKMNPAALLEDMNCYTENKPGFSYPCDNHSDGQVLGRGSSILGDGERRQVHIWLGCPLKLAQDPYNNKLLIFQAVASLMFNLLPYCRGQGSCLACPCSVP